MTITREYSCETSQTKFGLVHVEQLHNEILALGIPAFNGLSFDGDHFTVRCHDSLSEEDLAKVAAIVAAHDGGVFASLYARVDLAVRTKIGQGFSYEGKVFSLSVAAQLKLLGLYQLRGSLTYPVRINTLGDRDCYDIRDEVTLGDLYFESTRRVQACVDFGTAIKDRIREARTLEDLQKIVIEGE